MSNRKLGILGAVFSGYALLLLYIKFISNGPADWDAVFIGWGLVFVFNIVDAIKG